MITLTDANELQEGIQTNRRKGSRDNIVEWTPRLQTAWKAAKKHQATVNGRRKLATPLKAEERWLFPASDGNHLRKSSLDSAWQRMIKKAIADGTITEEQRFSPHDLKRAGITRTKGTRAEKQDASGHREEAMLDIYDHSLPVVKTPED